MSEVSGVRVALCQELIKWGRGLDMVRYRAPGSHLREWLRGAAIDDLGSIALEALCALASEIVTGQVIWIVAGSHGFPAASWVSAS